MEHADEIANWFKLSIHSHAKFHKPILDRFSIELVKLLCDSLTVSSEVFVTSVEVIEEYLRLKEFDEYDNIGKCVCIIACAVLLSVKFVTSHHDVKVTTVQKAILEICKERVDANVIKQIEIDILGTIQKVPVTTMTTDVTMLLRYYVAVFKITTNLQPLCLEILNVVYITKSKVIEKLKATYALSSDAIQAYQIIMKNRLFFPACIILCAFKLTKFNKSINMEKLVEDMSQFTRIHGDHLKFLSGILVQIITDAY